MVARADAEVVGGGGVHVQLRRDTGLLHGPLLRGRGRGMNWPLNLGTLALGAILGYAATRLVLVWASRRMLDMPCHRSSHTRPTPSGGGLGVLLAVITSYSIHYTKLYEAAPRGNVGPR